VRRIVLLILGAGLAGACALPSPPPEPRNAQEAREPWRYYYRDSIHYNTFPETFGQQGPYWVGRPGVYRY